MDNSLESIPVVFDRDAELSFWCWYEFPNYGTDGFYVEVNDGSGWQTLDFIGSGGALGTLTTGNDWMKYTYDLPHYSEGSSVVLHFRLVSDNSDVVEGVYIDDVKIQKHKPDIMLTVPHPGENVVIAYQLYQNYPNPFNPSTSIRYDIPTRSTVRLEIYNMLGQEVVRLVNKEMEAGIHEAMWNSNVASGVYFCRLEAIASDNATAHYTKVRKMLLLR